MIKKEAQLAPLVVKEMTRADEKKLDDMFNGIYAKQESNSLKFQEFMIFVLDKSLINQKQNLRFFVDLYTELYAAEDEVLEQALPRKASILNTKVPLSTDKNVNKFTRNKFLKMLDRLSKVYYPGVKKPLDTFLAQIFVERHITKTAMNGDIHRMMMLDEMNRRILQENVLRLILSYEADLQIFFVCYLPENYHRDSFMLDWYEVSLMNLKMPTAQFCQLLVDAMIYPTLINYEKVEDTIMRILPSTISKENAFYQAGYLEKAIEKMYQGKYKVQAYEGDPKVSFYEFQFLLGRLALEVAIREQIDIKKDALVPIRRFFDHHLGLGEKMPDRKHLLQYHNYLSYKKQGEEIEKVVESTEPNHEIQKQPEKLSDIEILQQKNNEFLFQKPEAMDMAEIVAIFQNEFPPLPKFNYHNTIIDNSKKRFENYISKQEEAKRKEEAKNTKKGNNKLVKKEAKSDVPVRPIIWEPLEPIYHPKSYEHMIKFRESLDNERNDYNEMGNFKTFSHIQSAPVLIPEVLYPVDLPEEAKPAIESMMMYFSTQNYYLAFQNLEKAQQIWLQAIKKDELLDETLLYFEFIGAQICEIAGQDEAAMNRFVKTKYYADRILPNHPDRALPFCGFGSVLYHLKEYELALRAFMKAKELRENSIGSENIENAVIYNNMGCCMHQMGKFFDAETCYLFSEALFEMHLGCFHDRTSNVKRNLMKLKKDSKLGKK